MVRQLGKIYQNLQVLFPFRTEATTRRDGLSIGRTLVQMEPIISSIHYCDWAVRPGRAWISCSRFGVPNLKDNLVCLKRGNGLDSVAPTSPSDGPQGMRRIISKSSSAVVI